MAQSKKAPTRLRVGALQYFIRPIRSWDEFRDQVAGLVRTAGDYGCRLLVFPEYFTVQLLTLGDVGRPMEEQIRHLARRVPEFLELMGALARECDLYVVAGTIPVFEPGSSEKIRNTAFFFSPDGTHQAQEKLHMTRFEREAWKVTPGERLKIFETEFGRLAIATCYDVEFPEVARAAARQDATILVVPSYTDDRQGFLRVRYCAHARAIENQMYVICSGTVGSLPMVPAVSLNYGQASILTPSDFPFARDGILAEGIPNQEMMVIGELNLSTIHQNRFRGTVRPLRDSRNSAELVSSSDVVEVAGSSAESGARQSARRRIVIRHTTEEDFGGIRELAGLIYPDIAPWSEDQLRSHLAIFPEGQFVAVDQRSGLVVGMCSSLIIDWDDYDPQQDWASLTASGTYQNHDPIYGRSLLAADVMVRPGMQGRGVGKKLYDRGRFGLARHLGLKRVLAGSRLRGYHRFADKMSAHEYVCHVLDGKLNDPTLSFQLNQGFRVLDVVSGYFQGDPESLGWAAVIEWLNEDMATDHDRKQGNPMFRRP
ncbi:MAG: carbon-nitrogen hydrolase family protein [Planctomycetota bacterium]